MQIGYSLTCPRDARRGGSSAEDEAWVQVDKSAGSAARMSSAKTRRRGVCACSISPNTQIVCTVERNLAKALSGCVPHVRSFQGRGDQICMCNCRPMELETSSLLLYTSSRLKCPSQLCIINGLTVTCIFINAHSRPGDPVHLQITHHPHQTHPKQVLALRQRGDLRISSATLLTESTLEQRRLSSKSDSENAARLEQCVHR